MKDILLKYSPISLQEMNGIRLMNRVDTKFVTTIERLRQLLSIAVDQYRVQEVDGLRIASYNTIYYDTPNCDMFQMHQHGHCDRQKVRIRTYVESQLSFMEVKSKDNRGRTGKKRVKLSGFDFHVPSERIDDETSKVFLDKHLGYDTASLSLQMENNFHRITLVNNAKTERLTIDFDMCFHNFVTSKDASLGRLVIIEIKRDGRVPSPILGMLRELRIKPMGFSKYCIGSALTNSALQVNRFKPRLHQITRIMAS